MKYRFTLVIGFFLIGITAGWAQRSLYGTASTGAADNKGVIFKTNEDGTGYTVVHNFVTDFPGAAPQSSLVLANGKLYGTTNSGGLNDRGIIFEYNQSTGVYSNKFDFFDTNGAYPSGGLVVVSGKLFGMTTQGGANGLGVIFEYDPVGNTYSKRFDFDGTNGGNPQGTMVDAGGGVLYGMTSNGGSTSNGVIFEYNTISISFTKKAEFSGSNGAGPYGDFAKASNGKLYGMTYGGGANGQGVLFEYTPGASSFSVKIDFDGTNGASPYGSLLAASDNNLYGLTSTGGLGNKGIMFQYVPAASSVTKLIDFTGSNGAFPFGSLLQASNSRLYGMTFSGGATDDGIIFEYDIAGSTFTKKFDFLLGSGPGNPQCAFVEAPDLLLYGLTPSGPGLGKGTLFSFDPATAAVQTKVTFSNSISGSEPQSGPVEASGKLYGMTSVGGANGQGVIYEFNPTGNVYTKKVDFSYTTSGANPNGTLVLSGTKLYGMNPYGGTNGDGVLFEYVPGATSVTPMFNFLASTSGSTPLGNLVSASNGLLYGLTSAGGPNGLGVLFSFDPVSSTFAPLYNFPSVSNGTHPNGSLIQGANGKLYGTTYQGGSGNGVVFEFDIATSTYTKKTDFNITNGQGPFGDLVQSTNGRFYGMTPNGGANLAGVIYEFDPSPATATLVAKHDFDGSTNGSSPSGSLIEVAPGKFYGTTSGGGTVGGGILFEFGLSAPVFTKKQDLGGINGVSPQHGSLVLVPGKTPQTITFNSIPAQLITTGSYSLTASSDSALPITFTSSDPLIATVSGSTVTFVQAGTVTITASQLGNGTYTYAQNVSRTLVINKNSQTITFATPTPVTYAAGLTFSLTGTASSSLAVTFASADLSIATISGGNIVHVLKAGSVNITASQSGDANYSPAPDVIRSLVIGQANQTVNFVLSPANIAYGSTSTINLVATATPSGLPVTFSSDTPLVASVSGATLTILKAGSLTITANQSGDVNYMAASASQPLTISPANQTITFTLSSPLNFGVAPGTLNGTATSGLTVAYSSSDPSVASVVGNILTINKPGGPITITADQAGNGNYFAAPSVTQTLTVNKGNQTITFNPILSKATTDPPFNLTATASSGLTVSYSSDNASVATITGNTVTLTGTVGTANITASQSGDTNWNAATSVVQPVVVVPKQSQTITFGALAARTFGDAPFNLSATASSGLAVTYASSDVTTASISGNTVTILKAGSVTITASQAGDGSFSAAPDVPQTLTIAKANQTITFGALANVANTDPPFTVSATASSGLTVTFTSSNTAVATVSGTTITIVGAGTANIIASQSGDANFNAAPSVSQSLTVFVKQSQTISFAPLILRAVGDTPFTLNATASSGLPITYTSSNPLVATVVGSQVTIVGVGSTDITANQSGNGSFLAAPSVTQPLTIQKGNQLITFNAPNSPTEGGPTFNLTGTASSGLPLTFTSLTTTKITISGNTVTPLKAGVGLIRASQAGNVNYNAATSVDQTFCIKPPIPIITVTNATTNSPTLTSSSPAGNVWLLNGSPISGASNQTYTVIKAGAYTVISSVEGCLSDVSAAQVILITGDLPLTPNSVYVYPNPTKDKLYVDLSSFEASGVDVSILDLTGRTLHHQSVVGGGVAVIGVGEQLPAVYVLVASQGNQQVRTKFVKN